MDGQDLTGWFGLFGRGELDYKWRGSPRLC
jgi:hypothetical protein